MARAFTAKANKDYPKEGIKKGEKYWYWAFYRGPTIRSPKPPRPSQLVNSPNLSQLYQARESFEDALVAATCPDDVVSAIDDAISAADDCEEAYEETKSNLEDAFTGGCPAIEDCEEKIGNIQEWKDALESAKAEIEQFDLTLYLPEGNDSESADWDDLNDEGKAQALEAAIEHANEATLDC